MSTDLSRLSLNTATTKRASLAEAVDAAAAAGLGAVGPWRDRVQEVGVEKAARIIRDAGLRVSSLCRGGFLTTSDDDAAAVALDDNRRAIREAATLGTHELILVVGGLDAASAPGAGARPYPAGRGDDPARDLVATRRRAADRIGELAPYAAEHGVRLVLEPLHPLFAADRAVISTLGQALDLAAPFDPDVVGVVVDTYHVWWDPDLHAQIARAGAEGRLAAYQVCDWVLPLAAEPLNSRGHVGDGYVDFATITRWVAEAGYTGDVEVEIFHEDVWARPPAQTVATLADRYTRHVLPYL
ncbi:Xylose isomerase domain protein TIM barrel [Xylanimonas cellulosilytica DSM 15894]|uniref:Xylose isomerase domain protein TIM barrel n=1 Tax=Xylanimonas cellulosilytica (strain DSM 15894 / JCM 12276 / CECT 5975 / KCTC 9989 / LMG 20990 / NBRC 107835 / XIL07) TaxID=446471 RepID=D1BY84_XYLCX|nr:sugar phosphate isomerase/epimerase family protein [Xylanimonas cellulosilytica]ACZ29927.1 Xylose isomerase domain protein TIM barrel [Xylanimonas cellulosilytica DSM 15894]